MTEIRLTELPVIALENFTDNDRFIIIDDGSVRQMTRQTLYDWITDSVKGERGEQGLAGRDGANGKDGVDGVDGKDGLSAYQLAVNSGYRGTESQWIQSLKGSKGDAGADGKHGWSPVLEVVSRGSDSVLQITDWIGGTGEKPTTLGFIGTEGIVSNINNASNIRGAKGDKGDRGDAGEKGEKGSDGKTVSSVVFNDDLSITLKNTDETQLSSEPPPMKKGWATYIDGQHSDTSLFSIPPNTQKTLPNNATSKTENLPTGVGTFYNPSSQKYLLEDPKGYYSIRVRFKVAASDTSSFLNLTMSRGTTDLPYSEDKALRGDNKVQEVSFNTTVYGSSPLVVNGLSIQVKAYERAVSIYNIEVTVAKLI